MIKDRMTVLTAMMDQGVIPVFYHPDVEVCKKVIQACGNGGAKCIEFTNRGDFASHVFLEVTRHFAKADPSVIMGVGSIVDAPTAGIYVFSPAGQLLNFVPIPGDETTNCAFGGDDLKTLFVTAGGSLFSIAVNVPGKPVWPRQN